MHFDKKVVIRSHHAAAPERVLLQGERDRGRGREGNFRVAGEKKEEKLRKWFIMGRGIM